MDYCAGGSVRSIIETLDTPLNEVQVAHVLKETLQGLDYLHSMNIAHM
jgi:serine/threonine protein kinase